MYVSATNQAISISYPASPTLVHRLNSVDLSFSGTGATGSLTVSADTTISGGTVQSSGEILNGTISGGNILYSVDIVGSGAQSLTEILVAAPVGKSLTVTLSAGGSGIVGKLNTTGDSVRGT